MALTPRQKRFVDEYLIDLNGTQAAIRAGYSQKTACAIGVENLRKPSIRKIIDAEMAGRAERTKVSQDYVITGVVDIIERCIQASPVLDRSGNQIFVEGPDGQVAAAYEFDAKNALKGYELLGKHLKLFTDKDKLDVELKKADIEARKLQNEKLRRELEDPDKGLPEPRQVVIGVEDASCPDAE